jgi:hypothetical protein
LAFFGVRASWIAVVGIGRRTHLLHCARPVAALGLAAALGFLLRVGVLCCVVVGGDPRTPFSAALGLAAALSTVLIFLKNSFKEQGRIEVKLSTSTKF